MFTKLGLSDHQHGIVVIKDYDVQVCYRLEK